MSRCSFHPCYCKDTSEEDRMRNRKDGAIAALREILSRLPAPSPCPVDARAIVGIVWDYLKQINEGNIKP